MAATAHTRIRQSLLVLPQEIKVGQLQYFLSPYAEAETATGSVSMLIFHMSSDLGKQRVIASSNDITCQLLLKRR
jgi:hypothetical protein